jgi:hypothetical protein
LLSFGTPTMLLTYKDRRDAGPQQAGSYAPFALLKG